MAAISASAVTVALLISILPEAFIAYDIYSSMFGGLPQSELDELNDYFKVFPNLKADLFNQINAKYYEIKVDNVKEFVNNHIYDEIKELFKDNKIENFEKLPSEKVEKKKFAQLYKKFKEVYNSARIQGLNEQCSTLETSKDSYEITSGEFKVADGDMNLNSYSIQDNPMQIWIVVYTALYAIQK